MLDSESLSLLGLHSFVPQRRYVFATTMAMSGVALICAVTSTAASAYGDPSTAKSFAWGVAQGATKDFEATLFSGLGNVVRETLYGTSGADAAIMTLKANSFLDADCPDERWCADCEEAQSETWVAAMAGIQ
jgi:hypothetical protein